MILKSIKILFFLSINFYFVNLFCLENKIIVKVNNKIITSYEMKNKILTTLFLSNENVNQENINRTKPLVLNSLIDLKLKENEIEKYKIKISDTELGYSLNTYAKDNLENFIKSFDNNKINYEIFKDDLKTELSWRKLIFFLYNKKIDIDESEIDLELKKILNDNEKKNYEYNLSEILISFKDQDDKEKKINEINQQITEIGFANTVIKYSESLSKNEEGNLGWVSSKSLSKKILDIVKNLSINKISKPIEMGNSLLFIKINDKRQINVKVENFENLKKKILDTKKNQMFNLYSNSHLSKLKNQSKIEYK